MIYALLSELIADIGENKCGTVLVKVVFLITNTPVTLKCGYYVNILEAGILFTQNRWKHSLYSNFT